MKELEIKEQYEKIITENGDDYDLTIKDTMNIIDARTGNSIDDVMERIYTSYKYGFIAGIKYMNSKSVKL